MVLQETCIDPDELLSHLIIVVIPMESTHPIPSKPPINLPQRPDNSTLRTKSATVIEIDATLANKEKQIRMSAINERDRLEDLGYGDQLGEMQETSWPVERILKGDFNIEMCLSYCDGEGNETLQWCRGCINTILRDKSESNNSIEVKIKWNNDCIQEGDVNLTKELLKKKNYNTEFHRNGSWREDLRHLLNNDAIGNS